MTCWLVFAAATAAALPSAPDRQGNVMPTSIPSRDGNIAIKEELDAARRASTVEAYDLFIARHPGHSLVAAARRERDELARKRPH